MNESMNEKTTIYQFAENLLLNKFQKIFQNKFLISYLDTFLYMVTLSIFYNNFYLRKKL